MNNLTYIFDGGSGLTMNPMAIRMARFLMSHPDTVHSRTAIAEGSGFPPGGRSVDTYVSEIRKALGPSQLKIICRPGFGYGWIGNTVSLVPAQPTFNRKPNPSTMTKFAVMTQKDVAKKLGISFREVRSIESRALAKLRRRHDLMTAWRDLLSTQGRVQYDPFREIWLFSVAENLALHPEDQQEEKET